MTTQIIILRLIIKPPIMKTLFSIIACLLLAATLSAQTYPYPQPGTMQGINFIGNFFSSPYNTSRMYVGDTIMCGYTYGILCGLSFECGTGSYNHFFRDDGGKIYYLIASCVNAEVLYYDFNLVVGDTFIVQTTFGGQAVVDSVGTMTMLNGQTRKYIRLIGVGNGTAFEWVEGIGDLERGFLGNADFEGGHDVLACHKDASGLLWVNPSYNFDCDSLLLNTPIPVGISELQVLEIDIYPNPSTGTFSVELKLERTLDIELEVVNAIGQVVYSEEIIDRTDNLYQKQLDLSMEPAGIYYVKIKTDEGVAVKKLILH